MAKSWTVVGDRRRENLFGIPGAAGVPLQERRGDYLRGEWIARLIGSSIAFVIVAWLVALLVFPGTRLDAYSLQARVGVAAALGMAKLFGALVLFLFPVDRERERFRWVAAGLVVLGCGSLAFGCAGPLTGASPDPSTTMYQWLSINSIAAAVFAIGLIPRTPPRLTRPLLGALLFIAMLVSSLASLESGSLPPLFHSVSLRFVADHNALLSQWATAWLWVLASVLVIISLFAAAGAIRHLARERMRGPLLAATVLLVGYQLHSLISPSTYGPLVTSADVLQFVFAATIAVGGVLGLRRISLERAAVLAVAQEQSERLAELTVLKADFTAMVVHELTSPLAAIRGYGAMLATGELDPATLAQVSNAIQGEVSVLTNLVSDVQTAAVVERDDFAIKAYPVALHTLVTTAAGFARTLPGNHRLCMPVVVSGLVWADPERIGQVLRNLLGNAAKYSPDGSPIELLVSQESGRARIEVSDHGPGIHLEDLRRIFEKFGRGRDGTGRKVAGAGLGLYLSKRIVQAHGSELTVRSTPGEGSVFGFDLESVL